MQVFLETERLVLRQFTMADLDNLVSVDADPDVMRFITGGQATSRDTIKDALLPGILARYRCSDGYGCWASIEKTTGTFLGWFHFEPRGGGPPGEIALGYRLCKSAWGKGYATEGARALIRKGFTELSAQRVIAETMAVNLASRRVLEKAGLKFVRIFHQPWPYPVAGREAGDAEYALGKTEWEQQNQPHTARQRIRQADQPDLIWLPTASKSYDVRTERRISPARDRRAATICSEPSAPTVAKSGVRRACPGRP